MSLKEFYAKELWTLCKVITDNFLQVSSLGFVFTKKYCLSEQFQTLSFKLNIIIAELSLAREARWWSTMGKKMK